VNESQIRKVFLIIENTMPFAYDDYKVELWRNLLQDVPFETAQANLRRYLLNPNNRFPPTPGQLAAGTYSEVPGVEATRAMFREREELARLSAPPPRLLQRGDKPC
jgi:hypothetical protein